MSEIEEIKVLLIKERNTVKVSNLFPLDPQYMKVLEDDITFLLSSLEREIGKLEGSLKALGSDLDVQKKWTDELKTSLEKEKEQTDYFRLEVNRLTDELAKEKERVERETISVNELSLTNQDLEERVKELEELVKIQNDTITNSEKRINEAEATLASIKADPSIGKLEIVDSFGEDD